MPSDITERIQKHIWLCYAFMTLAVVGFIDVVSRTTTGDSDIGVVTQTSGGIAYALGGGIASSIVFTSSYFLTSFWFIWFCIATYELRAANKLRTVISKEGGIAKEVAPKDIRRVWRKFARLFWIAFLLKIGIRFLAGNMATTELIYSVAALQIPVLFVMAWGMGMAAYRFTGKKSSLLYSIFGFFWFGVVGIFIGFYFVKRLRDKKLRELGEEPYPKNAGVFARLFD